MKIAGSGERGAELMGLKDKNVVSAPGWASPRSPPT